MNKTLLYLAMGCVGLVAQIPLQVNRQTVDMDERTLQEKYHIAATEDGLIGALQHQDPAVRNFAATKLASDGKKNAILPILAALAQEKEEGVKVILAESAAQLGSAEGFDALKGMCEDRSWSPGLRMVAAQTMVTVLGRQECLSDVLEALRSAPDDVWAVPAALGLLPRFSQVSPSQLDEMRELSATFLKSPKSSFRMFAGVCVRDLGGPWAISQLRAAIDAEREESVRKSLAQDLVSVGQ